MEEPNKRSGPVRGRNWLEISHTRAYSKLPTVCVICGVPHDMVQCNKPKTVVVYLMVFIIGNLRGCWIRDLISLAYFTFSTRSCVFVECYFFLIR